MKGETQGNKKSRKVGGSLHGVKWFCMIAFAIFGLASIIATGCSGGGGGGGDLCDKVRVYITSDGTCTNVACPGSELIVSDIQYNNLGEIISYHYTCGSYSGDVWHTFNTLGMISDFTYTVNGQVCGNPVTDADGDGYTETEGDCDDNDPYVNPGASEICDDGIDNDCDGAVDCADDDCFDDSACDACDNIAGSWDENVTVVFTVTVIGDQFTDAFDYSRRVSVEQNDCAVEWNITAGGARYHRSGYVEGNIVSISGESMDEYSFTLAAEAFGCTDVIVTQNTHSGTGRISGNTIDYSGSGTVQATVTYMGMRATFHYSITEDSILTRCSMSGDHSYSYQQTRRESTDAFSATDLSEPRNLGEFMAGMIRDALD